jgi:DNA-binding CsgD family transcriptional regulator
VIAGAQGREEECLRLVARIDEAAHGLGARQMPIIARSGLGLLYLGAGAPLSAADEFEAIRRAVVECGGQQPLWTRWLPNLAEAYVRGGRSQEAEALLDGVPEWSDADALSWGAAADARCRGLLEDTASFDAHFERALELHGHAGNPFERARTELCYGERLRRARRRADARRHLRDAFVTFERLDAAPWAGRARGELEATGLSLEPSQPQPLAELTPHELRIAGVVASGAKNREIAARLFVTPKTVEYHLRSIYRKLNIRSRSELVRLYLAESQLEASSASA